MHSRKNIVVSAIAFSALLTILALRLQSLHGAVRNSLDPHLRDADNDGVQATRAQKAQVQPTGMSSR